MIYTEEEKKRIDNILLAFKSYIDENDVIDVVYSKKVGFIWIGAGECAKETCPVIIEGASVLLRLLFEEIECDIWKEKDPKYIEHNELIQDDVVEIRCRAEHYIESMTESKEYCQAYLDFFLEHILD